MKRNKLFFEITFWLILLMLIPIVSFASEFSKDTAAIEKAAKSVLKLEVMDHNNYLIATGSGFIAFDHTSLITNYHVVEGAGAVVAISDEGNRYQLDSVLCADKEMDIAILGFSDPVEYEPLKLFPDKNHPRGSEVIAIGSPIGLKNTVSSGIISSVYEENGIPWIQITAPISPGSSGGAVFNNKGEVIGISSASYVNGQNLNLAINIGEAMAMHQAWNGQKNSFAAMPQRAGFDYTGIYLTEVESAIAAYDNIEWTCPTCGETNKKAFCLKCGTARPLWICACGELCISPFCGNCGRSFDGINQMIEKAEESKKENHPEETVRILKQLGSFNSLGVQTCLGDQYNAKEEIKKAYGLWAEEKISMLGYKGTLSDIQSVNDTDDWQALMQAIYEKWCRSLIDAEKYEETLSLIGTVPETVDSGELEKTVYYFMGVHEFENEHFQAAAEAFEKAGDYTGAADLLEKSREMQKEELYQEALAYENAGNLYDAVRNYQVLSAYKDSADRLEKIVPGGYPRAVKSFAAISDSFQYNLAPVQNKAGKWGFIDIFGKLVIPCQYDDAKEFISGYSTVTVKRDGKIQQALINTKGEEIIPFGKYEQLGDVREDRIAVKINGKWGFIDMNGELVVQPLYDDVTIFKEGYAAVQVGEKWGAIDLNGKQTIAPQMDSLFTFSDGIATAKKGDRAIYFDTEGNQLFSTDFAVANKFSEGLATCLDSMEKVGDSWLFRCIDQTGKTVFTIIAKNIGYFIGDYCWYVDWDDNSGGIGTLNKKGEIVIPASYDIMDQVEIGTNDGTAAVKKNNKWGVIDMNNNIIVPLIYDAAEPYNEGFCITIRDDTVYIFDKSGA